MEKGGHTEITARLEPLEAKPAPAARGTMPMPGFDEWVTQVQAMPAEQQVQAVSDKLIELNPGFDGKVTQQISEGVVLELAFSTDHVTDISPVRALLGLKNLNCSGTLAANSGVLNDLSPLSGMKLRVLGIQATQVTDLSPLRDMTLTHLRCTYAKISDLSPLKGQSLTDLQVENTSVRDLSPLEGMPLKSFQSFASAKNDIRCSGVSSHAGHGFVAA